MTTTMNHTNCAHPATKAARAACRKIRAQGIKVRAAAIESIIAAYHEGVDTEEILGMMVEARIPADPNLDIEEIIASL